MKHIFASSLFLLAAVFCCGQKAQAQLQIGSGISMTPFWALNLKVGRDTPWKGIVRVSGSAQGGSNNQTSGYWTVSAQAAKSLYRVENSVNFYAGLGTEINTYLWKGEKFTKLDPTASLGIEVFPFKNKRWGITAESGLFYGYDKKSAISKEALPDRRWLLGRSSLEFTFYIGRMTKKQ